MNPEEYTKVYIDYINSLPKEEHEAMVAQLMSLVFRADANFRNDTAADTANRFNEALRTILYQSGALSNMNLEELSEVDL